MLTDQILLRIAGEFLEMPGLHLTLTQAQRLWALDQDTCAEALELLVLARFLHRTSTGSYVRIADRAVRASFPGRS